MNIPERFAKVDGWKFALQPMIGAAVILVILAIGSSIYAAAQQPVETHAGSGKTNQAGSSKSDKKTADNKDTTQPNTTPDNTPAPTATATTKAISTSLVVAPTTKPTAASLAPSSPRQTSVVVPAGTSGSRCYDSLPTYYAQHTVAINNEYAVHQQNVAAITEDYNAGEYHMADYENAYNNYQLDLAHESGRWNDANNAIDTTYKNQLIAVDCPASLYSGL